MRLQIQYARERRGVKGLGHGTAGSGWQQLEGQEPVSMEAGNIAYFPAGAKRWRGSKADSWFSHLAFEVPGTDTSNEWLEPVTDEAYGTLK